MTDVIHKPPTHSIYERTDYYTDLELAHQFALMRSWNFGVASEIQRRAGFPVNDRHPHFSPLVANVPRVPLPRKR